MELVIDFTKFELGELFHGLKLYGDLMEQQLKALQDEQEVLLGVEWSTYKEVFIEALPTNLRYSVIVALITNIEWALNNALGLLNKNGIQLPSRKKSDVGSENARKMQFLNQQHTPTFSHPFEKRFLAINNLRNAIVHNAGKPERYVGTVGPFDLHFFDEKIIEAGSVLQPGIMLGDTNLWIQEGIVSTWVVEAHDWLSALYDFLQLNISFALPVTQSNKQK